MKSNSEAIEMSDKHDSKQKHNRAKAHVGGSEAQPSHEAKNSQIDGEIKDAAGQVQEDLGKVRASANHAHKG
jgi:hypothetical protein